MAPGSIDTETGDALMRAQKDFMCEPAEERNEAEQ
jgi:hypothetical protein